MTATKTENCPECGCGFIRKNGYIEGEYERNEDQKPTRQTPNDPI